MQRISQYLADELEKVSRAQAHARAREQQQQQHPDDSQENNNNKITTTTTTTARDLEEFLCAEGVAPRIAAHLANTTPTLDAEIAIRVAREYITNNDIVHNVPGVYVAALTRRWRVRSKRRR